MVRIPLKVLLRVHTGTMFAGKTEGLLADLRRYERAGRRTVLFKPVLDDRYAEEEVVTHTGDSKKAIPIRVINEIFQHINNTVDVVGIDEVQFFNIEETIEVIEKLLFMDIPVSVAGLDMDYKGRPFGAVPFLMAMAEEVVKYEAVCIDCGDNSHFEYRKDKGDSNLVKLGGSDEYDSLCRACRKKRIMRENQMSFNIGESDGDEFTDIQLSGRDIE